MFHIGQAKAALLNDYFAHEYLDTEKQGTLICRFDDTNPAKDFAEFQDLILQDLELLGIRPDRMSYSSDYFQEMYEGCVKLIQLGKAYADSTTKEAMGDERWKGPLTSACNEISSDDSLRVEEVKAGLGHEWCIRTKISVDNPVKCLRDPVIYCCNLQPHHRTGTIISIIMVAVE
jgi:glutamyl-tRNA synthetase